jgi:hypothetical protein
MHHKEACERFYPTNVSYWIPVVKICHVMYKYLEVSGMFYLFVTENLGSVCGSLICVLHPVYIY